MPADEPESNKTKRLARKLQLLSYACTDCQQTHFSG